MCSVRSSTTAPIACSSCCGRATASRRTRRPSTAWTTTRPPRSRPSRAPTELVSALVDRFHLVARDYDVVLVLGTDYAGTQLPDELSLNARLANEFGASVIPVVGGRAQSAEAVLAETRNAYRAYDGLGCDVLAMVANRVAREDRDEIAERLASRLPVPTYVLPDEPALSAPTVAQIAQTLGAKVLLGDDSGLARDALGFVFGGAMLPNFLGALTPRLPRRHPGRPRRPGRRLARRAQRRHPADSRRAAHPGRGAERGDPHPSPPASPRAPR